jgi:MFS superfamily sulfate permease-like transporter
MPVDSGGARSAAMRLIDLTELHRIARFRRSEIVLAVATTAAVLAVGVLYGIAVAIALSVLDLLRRIARPHERCSATCQVSLGCTTLRITRTGANCPDC